MGTNTFSLEEAYGTPPVRKKVQFAQGTSGETEAVEDGPEKILSRIEQEDGVTFDEGTRAQALEDIRKGGKFEITFPSEGADADEAAPVKKDANTFSLDEAYGVHADLPSDAPPATTPTDTVPDDESIFDPVTRAAKSSFDFIKGRILTEFGQLKPGDPNYHPDRPGMAETPSGDEELEWRQKIAADPSAAKDLPKRLSYLAPQAELHGFIENLENPLKLMTSDSLPANFISMYANLPQIERKKFDDARQVMMQENIASHPDKFPAVSVEAAQKAIDARKAKQSPGVKALWGELFQAAKEDPGKFGGQLVNSIVADPELLVAPVGLGTKVLERTAELATGATRVSGRVVKLADRVMDSGSVAAAMNTAITAQDQLARGVDLNYNELKSAAGMGAVIGGTLGTIFSGGARAKLLDLDAERLKGTLEETLRERAKYDVEAEAAYRDDWRPGTDTPTQQRIQDMLGITSKTDREKAISTRRSEIKKTFKNEADYADYLAFKAQERIDRAATIHQEQTAKAEAEAAQRQVAAAAADVRIPSPDAPEGVSSSEVIQALRTPEHMRTPQHKVAVRALRNEGVRGSADPETLARIGVVGLGAAAGAAMAPEDQKLAGTFFGGLAGLAVPAGGSVLRRMRQSGAISAEGDIISNLVKAGKLVEPKDFDTIRKEDFSKVKKSVAGDQVAMKELYEENYPKLERAANKFLREAGPKLGIDAADIVQDAFVNAFNNLDKFKGDSQFYTWMHAIVRNEGLQAIRAASRKPDQVSIFNPARGEGGGDPATGGIAEVDNSPIKASTEGITADLDTPENVAIRDEVNTQLVNAINKLNPKVREVIIKSQLDLMTDVEIASALNEPLGTIQSRIARGKAEINESIAKGYGAKPAKPEAVRLPRNQRGAVDERLLKLGALATLGAGAGAYMNKQNRLAGAGIGAIAMLGLASKGKSGGSVAGQVVQGLDYTTGLISTRVMNKSKELWMRMLNHERVVLRDTHRYLQAVDPFLVSLEKLKPAIKGLVSRAILTGDNVVTERLLKEIGDPDLIQGWKDVRSTLDKVGDQLVHLKRFKNKELDYFPRIVTDVAGLTKALGRERGTFIEESLHGAEVKAIRERGTGLSDLERSLIINKILKDDANKASQPGFAKNRVVEEITPELQQFYATPTESLHSYLRSAVQDIERAKFFGKDLEVVTKDGKDYTNPDKSIGTMVDRLIREGKLKPEDQAELSLMLKSRFINGERSPSEIAQLARNLNTAGLLGNFRGAASQLGDIVTQAYTQDTRSTLTAIIRQLTGRKIVNMKDFGLSDHIAEEFVSTTRSAKLVNFAFKWSLFKGIDEFGKNNALNAAVLRASRIAKSEKGVAELGRRYAEALGPEEFKQWIKDLQKGEKSDLVNQMAFAELSRSQPITRIELPQAYLDHPNGRLLYQFKTFMLKQLDLARRDGYNEIKKGNIARGTKNLTMIGLMLGVSGMSTSAVKDFLAGKSVDLKSSDVVTNALKTFGLTQYVIDQGFGVSKEEAAKRRKHGEENIRAQKAEPVKALGSLFTPPYKLFEEMATADPKLWSRIPIIGPTLYEHVIKEEKKK